VRGLLYLRHRKLCYRLLLPSLEVRLRPNRSPTQSGSDTGQRQLVTDRTGRAPTRMEAEGQKAVNYALYPQGCTGARHALQIWGDKEYEYSPSDLEDFDDSDATDSDDSQGSANSDGRGDDRRSDSDKCSDNVEDTAEAADQDMPVDEDSETSCSIADPGPQSRSKVSSASSRWTGACPPLDLNYDALKHIGTYYPPGNHGTCIDISALERGVFHEIRILHFGDGWSCIGRFTHAAEILERPRASSRPWLM